MGSFARALGAPAGGGIAYLMGYDAGIQAPFVAEAVTALGTGTDVVVFNGSRLVEDGFTAAVPAFLAGGTSRVAIAVCEATPSEDALSASWQPVLQRYPGRVGVLPVASGDLDRAVEELTSLGLAAGDRARVALGWLTLRVCGCARVVAVGGGAAAVGEAACCAATRRRESAGVLLGAGAVRGHGPLAPWHVLDVCQDSREGWVRPFALTLLCGAVGRPAPVPVVAAPVTSKRSETQAVAIEARLNRLAGIAEAGTCCPAGAPATTGSAVAHRYCLCSLRSPLSSHDPRAPAAARVSRRRRTRQPPPPHVPAAAAPPAAAARASHRTALALCRTGAPSVLVRPSGTGAIAADPMWVCVG